MKTTFCTLLLSLFLLAFSGAGGFAQENGQKFFDAESWQATAARAEEIIERSEASSPALETLRANLAKFRTEALGVQDAHTARISTIESQLKALGPPPEEGQTEAEAVAARRVELTEQLSKARAPVLAAQEAYKRADGLIGEIDTIIRDRQADQLFTLGASPLNFSLWPKALEVVTKYVSDVSNEVQDAYKSEAQSVLLQQNLPVILVLLVVGMALTTRARTWALRLIGFEAARKTGSISATRALFVSTTQVIVPMLGIWAILQALQLSGFVGIRGSVLVSAAPFMALAIFGASWVGRTLFTSDDGTPLFFDISEADGRRSSRASSSMGIALALQFLLQGLSRQADWPETTHVVLSFPVVVLSGFLLFRMGVLLGRYGDSNHGDGVSLQTRVFKLINRALIVMGVVGPILAAIGYFTASVSFVFPAVQSLALFGTGVIFFRLLTGLFDEILGVTEVDPEEEAEPRLTMMPVILGFILILIGTPLLALIWGARVSDLQEVWTMISEGFAVGDRRISVSDFLTFAIVFGIGYTATRLLQSALRTTVLPRTDFDTGGRNAVITGTGYVGLFLASLAAITAAGFDLSSIAIVAGALSVGIGFGLQAIVSNFVSGIILLVERPIKEGDWIEVGAYSGYVRKISVRSTEIETFDRATVVVPNADFISGTVTNYTHSGTRGRVRVPVGVAYDSDPREVESILQEIANAHHMIDRANPPNVVFMGFGADSMDFEIRAILKDVNWVLSVKSDMNYQIVKRFREAGIEIPFSQRDINLRNLDDVSQTLKSVFGDPK